MLRRRKLRKVRQEGLRRSKGACDKRDELSLKEQACVACVLCYVISVMSDSLQSLGLQPTRLLCPWDPPGKNTGVGCHALLQGIFLTQESNPSILHLALW